MTRQHATGAFVDLATYSDRERYLYATAGENLYKHKPRGKSDWSTQVPVELHVDDDLDTEFKFGEEYIFRCNRVCDYYTSMWFEINITNVSADIIWVENLFHNIIENLEFGKLNGSCYQRFTSEILDAYAAFTRDSKYFKMINPSTHSSGAITMVLPIPIFFSRSTHDAYPITVLPLEFTTIRIKLSALDNLIISKDVNKSPIINNFRVYVNGVVVNKQRSFNFKRKFSFLFNCLSF
jgi:hypothetical protein